MPRRPRRIDLAKSAEAHGRPAPEGARVGLVVGLPVEGELLDLQLGPLKFAAPIGNVSEAIGDGLEAVGAAVVASERRPRPVKLSLPVRGVSLTTDPAIEGRRLRRQLRQLMNNSRLRLQGLYMVWEQDEELDGWLQIGAGELAETDPGISFGEFQLELSEVFRVGRPGTHRPGRRAIIADRRSGEWPRDTRRLLYSTDFAATAIFGAKLLALPGAPGQVVRSSLEKTLSSPGFSPIEEDNPICQFEKAIDGEALTWEVEEEPWPGRTKYLDQDDWGSTRVWDLTGAATYPPVAAGYTEAHDLDPTGYGWERVYGDLLDPNAPFALDNGACRMVWLGAEPHQGLALEAWHTGGYHRIGRVNFTSAPPMIKIIELTNERVVIELRATQMSMRVILQRGWRGPRLESYNDLLTLNDAALEYMPHTPSTEGGYTETAETPTWVKKISGVHGGDPWALWAQGTADEVIEAGTFIKNEANTAVGGVRFHRPRVLVAHLMLEGAGLTAGSLAVLSLVDAQAIPILVAR